MEQLIFGLRRYTDVCGDDVSIKWTCCTRQCRNASWTGFLAAQQKVRAGMAAAAVRVHV